MVNWMPKLVVNVIKESIELGGSLVNKLRANPKKIGH